MNVLPSWIDKNKNIQEEIKNFEFISQDVKIDDLYYLKKKNTQNLRANFKEIKIICSFLFFSKFLKEKNIFDINPFKIKMSKKKKHFNDFFLIFGSV